MNNEWKRKNLEGLHLELCSGWSWLYRRARVCAPCSDLRESGSRGRVDYAVANPISAMLLASSHPHHDFSINVLGARIEVWPVNLPSHLCILVDATVYARMAVRLGQVVWVEIDIGHHLALFREDPCLELGARSAIMW